MRKFVISTDTTSDLPADFIAANDIDIHPLYYTFGDDVIYGAENKLTEKEFYARMRAGAIPTTMAGNPEVSKELFTKRVEAGFDVLHIAFSSALSSSSNSAHLAAMEVMEEYPEARIIVIDSLSASMGEGLVTYKAIQLQKQGKSLDEIESFIDEHMRNFSQQFTVDDLNHLYRGGRVSKATAIIGSIAGIKPMLHVSDEGKLMPVGKVRGRKKSLITLVDTMAESMGDYKKENDVILITHGDCIEDAEFVAAQIKERFGFDALINYVCPTIGSHSGPGTVALFFMAEHR